MSANPTAEDVLRQLVNAIKMTRSVLDPLIACAEVVLEMAEEPHRFGIAGGCICGKCDSCIDRGVTP